jgi:predicted GIY-YIG superfamily endonuclease
MRGLGKRYVYILRSDSDSSSHYVGITSNVDERLSWHNAGPAGHTVAKRPWSIVVSLEFPTETEAVRFERYLKTGSGRAFAKRHFGSAAAAETGPRCGVRLSGTRVPMSRGDV